MWTYIEAKLLHLISSKLPLLNHLMNQYIYISGWHSMNQYIYIWVTFSWHSFVNSLRQGDSYICHWTGSSLVQVMATCLFVCQAITCTNADLLSIWPLGTNCCESLLTLLTFSLKKMHLKMLSAMWWPFCLVLIVLKYCGRDERSWWH